LNFAAKIFIYKLKDLRECLSENPKIHRAKLKATLIVIMRGETVTYILLSIFNAEVRGLEL